MNKEDEVFRKLLEARAEGRNDVKLLEVELYKLLLGHAIAVMYGVLGRPEVGLAHRIVSRAFMVMKTFEDRSTFHTWFHRVAVNGCKMYIRAKENLREVDLEQAEGRSVESNWTAGVLIGQLERGLRPKEKEILDLKKEDLTDKEIAERLNLTRGTVASRWFQLKKKLRRKLL